MKEIPHKWFFKGREVEMIGPELDRNNRIVGLKIKDMGYSVLILCDNEGGFGPHLCYELIN